MHQLIVFFDEDLDFHYLQQSYWVAEMQNEGRSYKKLSWLSYHNTTIVSVSNDRIRLRWLSV